MTFPDISERPGATEAPCVFCVVTSRGQQCAAEREAHFLWRICQLRH